MLCNTGRAWLVVQVMHQSMSSLHSWGSHPPTRDWHLYSYFVPPLGAFANYQRCMKTNNNFAKLLQYCRGAGELLNSCRRWGNDIICSCLWMHGKGKVNGNKRLWYYSVFASGARFTTSFTQLISRNKKVLANYYHWLTHISMFITNRKYFERKLQRLPSPTAMHSVSIKTIWGGFGVYQSLWRRPPFPALCLLYYEEISYLACLCMLACGVSHLLVVTTSELHWRKA